MKCFSKERKIISNFNGRTLLLLSLAFVCASSAVYGQNPGMVGTWVLDSIAIARIERDSTETVVKYNDVKDTVKPAFDTIVFGNDQCRLIAGNRKISASYTLTDTLLTVANNKEFRHGDLLYQYKLDKSLTLKNVFFTSGHTVTGYNVEMKFIKQ